MPYIRRICSTGDIPSSNRESTPLFYLRLLGGLALEENGEAVTGRAAQKRRLALLALLAAARGAPLTRDRITGLLWPDKQDQRGRRLLAQALLEIGKALGKDAFIKHGDDLALDPDVVGSDVNDFLIAVDEKRHDDAVALYHGPFLDGFYSGESVDFEQWIDGERATLARKYRDALIARAEGMEARGDRQGALAAWRVAANEDRFDSRIALCLLRAFDAAGNRAGALQFARVHEALLEAEFGTSPAPEFLEAVQEIRDRTEAVTVQPITPRPTGTPAARGDPSTAGGPRGPASPPAPGPLDPPDPDTEAVEEPASRARPVEPMAPAPAADVTRQTPRRPLPVPGGAVGGALVVAVLMVVAVAIGYVTGVIGASPEVGSEIIRVAVLPFEPSDSADVAFADGFSQQIIEALAGIQGLEVKAWSASNALRGADAAEAAAQLGVSRVVSGSVHKDRDSLRVRVELSGSDGFRKWGDAFDRSLSREVFTTWDDVARGVLAALGPRLAGQNIQDIGGGTTNHAAMDRFDRGRRAWFNRTPEGLDQALLYFTEAVKLDSTYARAHVGIADAHNIMGAYDYAQLPPDSAFPTALRKADRALELAPGLGEAHAARANALFAYWRDWDGAEKAYEEAIRRAPHYPEAFHWYSLFLIARGDDQKSIEMAREALRLDSLSSVMGSSLARHHYFRGDYQRAVELYQRALSKDPSFLTAFHGMGLALLELDRPDDALAQFRAAAEQIGFFHPMNAALQAHAHGRAERPDSARAILAQLQAVRDAGHWIPDLAFALVHLGLNDVDAAIDAFEAALENRSSAAPFYAVDPLSGPLRDHPRFQALIRRGLQPIPRSP